MPVIRTYFSTPNDVLITGIHSISMESSMIFMEINFNIPLDEMRLMPSLTNSSFFSLQFLTPERTWASVCSNIPNIQICNTFGYNSVDVMRMVSDNVHTYTELACPPDAIKIEQCTVKFKYDYISVYGCSNTLEIYCSNMEGRNI